MFIQSLPIHKYVRTPHLEGSRLQKGDSTAGQVSLKSLAGKYAVLEEKVDGANSGWSYSGGGDLLLQSRGHYLAGGPNERQWNALKLFARTHEAAMLTLLEDRYVMYSEWAYEKHSVYYDKLPHYLHEFDILDLQTGKFLSTARRHAMLAGSPILSVPVLYAGPMPTDPKLLWKLVYRSLAKTKRWKESFEATVAKEKLPLELTWKQTDVSDKSEGLYIKIENDEEVLERYKLVRWDFVQTILESDSHHNSRPILPNQLAQGVDFFAPTPTVTWESLGLKTLHSIEELAAASMATLEGDRT